MNPKSIPWFLAVLVVLGLLAFLPQHGMRSKSEGQAAGQATVLSASRVLQIDQRDIVHIRVKRDYWNTYTLDRTTDGSWKLVDPSSEPASQPEVEKLLATVECIPVISTIDLPADDSERHREYGLWTPSMELTVTTTTESHTLTFGKPTTDGKGVYCARIGQDKVYIVATDAVQTLSQDMSVYRQEKNQPSQ